MTECDDGDDKYCCPWCGQPQTPSEIRLCSGYQPRGYTDDELRDAYSDPTDAAKLQRMLGENQ
jgi:hypothetical protein